MKAAIFDLDGTLLDSMPVWANAGKDILAQMGIQAEKDLGAKLLEMNMTEGAAYMIEKYRLSISIEEMCAKVNHFLSDAYRLTIPQKEGVKDFLEFLKRKGVRMAICTNSDRELFTPALERLGILDFFEKIFTSTEEMLSKSNPEFFMKVSTALNASPKECWVFEDALYAVKVAAAAGYKTAGIYDETSRKNADEMKKICSAFFCNYIEVKKFFESEENK